MSVSDVQNKEKNQEDIDSLKGTLFSTIVFVGGGITLFILTLFYFYMTRL